LKLAYWLAGLFALLNSSTIFIAIATKNNWFSWSQDKNSSITMSMADVLIIIPIIAAIVFAVKNFNRTLSLGANRTDIVKGHFLSFGSLILFVIIIANIFYNTIDKFLNNSLSPVGQWLPLQSSVSALNINALPYSQRGVIFSILVYALFLMVWVSIVYALFLVLDRKSGWVFLGLLCIFFAVFVPIFPLCRSFLHWFISIILLQKNSYLLILGQLLIIGLFYIISQLVAKNKEK
jgi:hypothetical protein